MSTAGMVRPFMKHTVHGQPLVRDVFEDIEHGMRRQGSMIDNGFYASAFRIMPTSSAMGEACGALAALAVRTGQALRAVPYAQLRAEISYNLTVA